MRAHINWPTITEPTMHTYIVLFRSESFTTEDAPFGFRCEAEDPEHAEEQCVNAYPDAEIALVWEGDNLQDALTAFAEINNG